jgi:hypothetical protein
VQGSETAHESRQDAVNFLASNMTLHLFIQPEADRCQSTVWDLGTVRSDVTKSWASSGRQVWALVAFDASIRVLVAATHILSAG